MEKKISNIISYLLKLIIPLYLIWRAWGAAEAIRRILAGPMQGLMTMFWGLLIAAILIYVVYCFQNIIFILVELTGGTNETVLKLNRVAGWISMGTDLLFRIFFAVVFGMLGWTAAFAPGIERSGNEVYVVGCIFMAAAVVMGVAAIRRFVKNLRER